VGAAVVSVDIGEKYRLGYEIGSVEGFGDWATTAEKVASNCWWRRRGRGRGRGLGFLAGRGSNCWWRQSGEGEGEGFGKGYLGGVCAGRRQGEGSVCVRALWTKKNEKWRSGGAVERWRIFQKRKHKCADCCVGNVATGLHACVREIMLPDANLIFQLKN